MEDIIVDGMTLSYTLQPMRLVSALLRSWAPPTSCLKTRPYNRLMPPHNRIISLGSRAFVMSTPLSQSTIMSSVLQDPRFNVNISLEEDAKKWKFIAAHANTPAYYVYDAPLQKSPSDDREYRIVRLENGLQAVLVHDAKTDKAAASLDVAVGHLSDPDDIPGLAHFCEHLLFMGTEQFPKENEYSEYLSKNGGRSNAYTASSNTNYYFSVSSDAFAGALERFSGFFHSPLFSPSCTLRELNAVDSENKQNLQNDLRRIFQLNKHLSRPGHPWRKFGTGNKKTLTEAARNAKTRTSNLPYEKPSLADLINGTASLGPSPIPSRVASPSPSVSSSNSENEADGGTIGRETRRRLIEWWSKEYCASRMSLTLIGKESLDELVQYASSMFSPILNRGQDPEPLITEHPFGNDERGSIVHVKTVMDFYAFELTFPIPYQAPHWKVKPASFLSHYIGHEGPGSLHAYLKNKGWITSLGAGEQRVARGFAMFKITVHLTKEGYANYREAILACHKYISLLRKSELPEWAQDEIKTIDALRFRFAEKRRLEAYATWISEGLKIPAPRSLVLSAPVLVWDWDEKMIRDLLAGLTVDNARVVVMARDHTTIGKTGPWSVEPWYGTEYTVERLDSEFVEAAKASNDISELFLPGPNEFIPENVDIEKVETSEPLKQPSLIKKTDLTEVWHKKDDQFWIPKAQVQIDVKSKVTGSSARASVLAWLYTDLVKDSLTDFAYDADLAGLTYYVGSTLSGFNIEVNGYNDKLHILAKHVLERIRSLEIKEDRLAIRKEELKRRWQNFFMDQTYKLSEYYGRYLLTDRQYTITEKLAEVDSIRIDEIRSLAEEVLSQSKFVVLVTGNLKKEDALRIASLTEEILGSKPVPKDQLPQERSRLLPKSCNYIWELQVPDPNQPNSSNSYYCHVGSISDDRLRTTFRLMEQILQEPAFNILRTQEQLGYNVYLSGWQDVESLGMRILIQSEKDPKYLETRIDAFLTHMRGVMESMDASEFEKHKKGLTVKWLEKLENLSQESLRFWSHISSGYLDFVRRERDAALLPSITKEEVLAMFDEFIHPASTSRSKLSIHMRSRKPPVIKLGETAAQTFYTSLCNAGVTVDKDDFNAQCANEPTVASVKTYLGGILREQAVSSDVLFSELDELVKKHPATGQGEIVLSKDVIFIKDGAAFREGLELSDVARPVDERVLTLSKF